MGGWSAEVMLNCKVQFVPGRHWDSSGLKYWRVMVLVLAMAANM